MKDTDTVAETYPAARKLMREANLDINEDLCISMAESYLVAYGYIPCDRSVAIVADMLMGVVERACADAFRQAAGPEEYAPMHPTGLLHCPSLRQPKEGGTP